MLRTFLTAGLLACLILAAPGTARITKIEISNVSDPAPDGYVTITGTAYGEVDPTHRLNAIIQDIELAPRNERGMVEYSTEFTIFKPPDGGNGLLFYEVMNRGFPMTQFYFQGLMRQMRERGYTIVWSAWQGDLIPNPNPQQHTMQVPVANLNGEEITDRIQTEYAVNKPMSTLDLSGVPAAPYMRHVSYEPVDLSGADAVLTRRARTDAPRIEVPKEDWAYADCTETPFPGVTSSTKICLKEGFLPDQIYELTYTAKNPLVVGLGLAAPRDLVSFLRYAKTDDIGTPNPVADTQRSAVMFGASQSSAYMHAFLQLGFNEDEDGRIVFEGMNPHIGPNRNSLNIRFGNTGMGRPSPPYKASPFTWMPSYDPLAERAGWLLERCLETNTCPKIVWTVTASEYWRGSRASLHTTDALGRYDEWIPWNVRMYFFASASHMFAAGPVYGICELLQNVNDPRPTLRALNLALERWVMEDEEPPPSQIPTLQDGTLVQSDEMSIGWPNIPGVESIGQAHGLTLMDYGPEFKPEDMSGILSVPPEILTGKDYVVLVPKVDADGNDIAGIRSTTVQAPLGTYTGWNHQRAGFREGDACGLQGSFIPFATTKAEREAAGDPRLSLEERYGDHEGYVDAVRAAANRLVAQRFLLPQDAAAIIAEAEASDILVPGENEPPVAVAEPVGLTTFDREYVLDGSKSADPEGEALTYSWKNTGKTASITGADTATPVVQFLTGAGDYSFELTVTDPQGASDTATATLTYRGR